MGKSIVILSASPRKSGNSDLLCDQFMQGALDAGNQVEKIFLANRKIAYCFGCEHCQQNDGKCIHNDDMSTILEKLIIADVIVMATPVYFYTMNAQMKTLIDRTVAQYTKLKNKVFYFIVTAADNNKQAMDRTIEGFRGFIDCLEGAKEAGILYGTGVWKKGEIVGNPAMKLANELGKHS